MMRHHLQAARETMRHSTRGVEGIILLLVISTYSLCVVLRPPPPQHLTELCTVIVGWILRGGYDRSRIGGRWQDDQLLLKQLINSAKKHP